MKICVVCGQEFKSNYNHKKTCSRNCSVRHKSLYRSSWIKDNKEYFSEYRKAYYKEKDVLKVKERTKKYRSSEQGKKKRREQQRQRLKRDPIYKAKRLLRKRLWEYKNRFGTFSMSKSIGCSWDEFKEHVESLFYTHPVSGLKMSWENYGKGGWEIDHVIPLCSASTLDDLLKLSHYTNLRPLWREDNVAKSIEDLKLKSDSNKDHNMEEK